MSDPHRLLLTYLIACRVVSQPRAVAKMAVIASSYNLEGEPAELLNEYISEINNQLREYDFKIERPKHQVLGDSYLVFVNTKLDDFVKASTLYLAAEIDAIKTVIDDIVENGSQYSVGLVNATQSVANTLNKSSKEAGALVERLVDEGWFDVTKDDKVVMSLRTLSELRPFLVDTYGIRSSDDEEGSLLACKVCGEIVTIGVSQGEAFHYRCFEVHQRQKAPEAEGTETFEVVGVPPASVT